MVTSVLYRIEKEPPIDITSAFSDVTSNDWFYNGVMWAQENNIVSGYNNKTFGPNDNITREQIAVILFNYAIFKGYDINKNASLETFADSNLISDYALPAMNWAVSSGLIGGRENQVLDPKGFASRAEVATILSRI